MSISRLLQTRRLSLHNGARPCGQIRSRAQQQRLVPAGRLQPFAPQGRAPAALVERADFACLLARIPPALSGKFIADALVVRLDLVLGELLRDGLVVLLLGGGPSATHTQQHILWFAQSGLLDVWGKKMQIRVAYIYIHLAGLLKTFKVVGALGQGVSLTKHCG